MKKDEDEYIVGITKILARFNKDETEFDKWNKEDDLKIFTDEEFEEYKKRITHEENCGSCFFWRYLDTPRFEAVDERKDTSAVEWDGTCHRSPPACFPGAIVDDLEPLQYQGYWPEIDCYGWCGEYRKGVPDIYAR